MVSRSLIDRGWTKTSRYHHDCLVGELVDGLDAYLVAGGIGRFRETFINKPEWKLDC